MSSTVKTISPVIKEISVSVPSSEVDSLADDMFKKLSHRAKVKGFRAGKVPLGVVKKMFSPSVYLEITEKLISEKLISAFEEHKIHPVVQPSVEKMEKPATKGEDFSFSVKVEIAPQLEEIVTEGIELEQESEESFNQKVSSAVEKELKSIQSRMATTKELKKPRSLKEGDQAKVKLSKNKDSKDDSKAESQQRDVVLDKDECDPILLKHLIGKKVNDSFEFKQDENDENSMSFTCEILSHYERTLPKIDDDLAKDAGEFDTLEQLRSELEKKIITIFKRMEKDKQKGELKEKLRQKNPMELPPTLVKKQLSSFLPEKEGEDDSSKEEEENEHVAYMKEFASNMLQDSFLINEVARHGDLKVTDDDIDTYCESIAALYQKPVQMLKAEFSGSRRSEAMIAVLEDKVFDFIVKKVKIVEIDSSAKELQE